MTRAPCCATDEKVDGLKKGPWTPDEDQKLVAYIQKHGHGSWRSLPLNAGLQRCGKSCRLRWTNYLRPDIKRGRFSQDEDQMIVHLHAILGNRWSAIASHLLRRTDNEIKNYWNTHLKKRLLQMGIDPVTHKSTMEEQLVLDSIIPGLRPVVSSNLTHMSQWDSFRTEAEARLSRQSSGLTSATSVDLQQITSSHAPSSQLNGLAAKTPNQGTASTTFMTSWRAQVAETLRPSFGLVELDKTPSNPVNFQTFLEDWESSLQGPVGQAGRHGGGFSTYGSPIDVPDFSYGTVSPQCDDAPVGSGHMFPTSAQITERLLASRCSGLGEKNTMFSSLSRMDSVDSQSLSAAGSTFSFAGNVICGASTTETQFSPTSTLHHAHSDHESSYTSSPSCLSNGTNCSFDVLAPSSFAYHDGDTELQSRVNSSMFNPQGPASFWSRQQVAIADVGTFSFNGGCAAVAVPAMLNRVTAEMPNNIPIPQFDF